MKQKKLSLITCVSLLCASFTVSAQHKVTYDFPGGSISPFDLCGEKRTCQCGSGGNDGNTATYQFSKKPFSPRIKNVVSVKSVAATVLGKSAPFSENSGENLLKCGVDDNVPNITEEDVDFTGDSIGIAFKYSVVKTNTQGISINADADVREMLSNNFKNTGLFDSLKSELTASYNKVKGKSFTIEGRYYTLALSENMYNSFMTGSKFKDCRDFLKEKDRAIITDISLVVFDLTRILDLDRKVIADLQTKLQRQGINIDLKAEIESKIIKSFKSTVTNRYAIVSWFKRKP